jgi:hypothetical protein
MESLPLNYNQIIAKGAPFEDTEFPPNLGSIFDPADHSDNANINLYTTIEWKRASEIFGEFVLLPDHIGADDIK